MKGSDVFPSKYLSAADLQDREITVVIAEVATDTMSDGSKKPVMTFQGAKKGMIVNKTNWNRIAYILKSDESDDWTGKEITLYTEIVDFQGKPTEAIRVKAAQRRTAAPSANAAPNKNGSDREYAVEQRKGYRLMESRPKDGVEASTGAVVDESLNDPIPF